MGEFAEAVTDSVVIETAQIPNWPRSTVEGHQGRLLIGHLEGQTILVSQGRIHLYEGYSAQQITFPIRVMQQFGIKTLIVTNASGGINRTFSAGDLMLNTDHINLLGFGGANPLVGPNDPTLGVRFPDMVTPYDADLRALALKAALRESVTLREGVYICVAGPSFETPAEIRALEVLGADAVGMSTVPEVIVARHAGIRVLGISGIANIAHRVSDPAKHTTHDEVMNVGETRIVPALTRLLRGVLRDLPV